VPEPLTHHKIKAHKKQLAATRVVMVHHHIKQLIQVNAHIYVYFLLEKTAVAWGK